MVLLAFRVVSAPVLVLAASVAQQRFGQAVGGRFVGLPLTSLPLLALLAAADGVGFAAAAATAALAGVVAQCVWAIVYVHASRRYGPAASTAAASSAFALTCAALLGMHLGLAPAAVLGAASVVGCLAVWPRATGSHQARPATGRELGGRMATGSAFTVAVTGASGSLGPQAAGLLGSYPVLTVVMAIATHRRDGAGAASDFLDGVVAGTLSVVAALATVAATLVPLGPIGAFPLAVGASLAAQVVPPVGSASVARLASGPSLRGRRDGSTRSARRAPAHRPPRNAAG